MIRKGTRVTWNWGSGEGEGKVAEVHHDRVTRKIAGAEVTRNATRKEPAYLIEQDDGGRVLKSRSEVERSD